MNFNLTKIVATTALLLMPVLAMAATSDSVSPPTVSHAKPLNLITENWPVDIPPVLSAADVKLYKKMFKLQRQLNRPQVAEMVSGLENRILMGNLVAERLLHPLTRAKYEDLKLWLYRYHDEAQAPRIYELANKRQPQGEKHRASSVSRLSVARYSDPDWQPGDDVKNTTERKKLLQRLKYYRQKERYNTAMELLEKPATIKILGEQTWAEVSSKLAQTMLNDGKYKEALSLARTVWQTSQNNNQAMWIAGFAAYRLGEYDVAAQMLRRLVQNVPVRSKYYARAAWWSARSYEKLGQEPLGKVYYNMAAQNKYDFYGMLAAEKLGRTPFIVWRDPQLKQHELKQIMQDEGVRRVIALAQIGEHTLAQNELKAAYERVPYGMDETLLSLSIKLDLPATSMALARNLRERDQVFLTGLYPKAEGWKPNGGFKVDSALMHAVMMQESGFNPLTESRAGARGLMQVMPDTADHIRNMERKSRLPKYQLFNPAVNLSLGQTYLLHLHGQLAGNIVQMIAGYNAGPGNVQKWVDNKNISTDDPVEFIESMPFAETRTYVKKVMANYWMYRKHFKADNPTLAALANSRWPSTQIALAGRNQVSQAQ